MVSDLEIGVALTIVAWLGVIVAVLHGNYVVNKIASGDYSKKLKKRKKENGPDE